MNSINKAIVVITFKTRETILEDGGTSSWALNRIHARNFEYAVCTRNKHHEKSKGPEKHAAAFLVGRISDVVESTEMPGRWLLKFSEYAEVAMPDVWGKGWRNPVRYTTLNELGIDPDNLDFKSMPEPSATNDQDPAVVAVSQNLLGEVGPPFMLTIAEAKLGLSSKFGVPVEAIEITIKA